MHIARIARRFAAAATSTQPVNYYRVLGVSREADSREIKSKYKELVKQYHPDVYKGNDKEIYKRIHEAYKVLVSPKKRMEYDESLKAQQSAAEGKSKSGTGSGKEGFSDLSDDYKESATAKDFYDDFNRVKTPKEPKDADEEYKAFFGKKVKTDFEKVNVQEDESLAGFSEMDRARAKFVEDFNEKNFVKKYVDSQGVGFNKTLEENIEILNNDTTEKKRVRILAKMHKKGLMVGTFKVIGMIGAAAFVFLFVLGFEIRKAKELLFFASKARQDEMEQEQKSQELKSKMVFD